MRRLMRAMAVVAVWTAGCGAATAQHADRILGTYRVIGVETKELSNVKIYKKGDTYEARVVWLQHPLDAHGKPRLDQHNPDPALRSVPGEQIVVLRGLRYNSKHNKWTGGRIYNPENGKSYDAMAEFESPTKLKMRGYLGVPSLGKTFIWTKIE